MAIAEKKNVLQLVIEILSRMAAPGQTFQKHGGVAVNEAVWVTQNPTLFFFTPHDEQSWGNLTAGPYINSHACRQSNKQQNQTLIDK